MKKNEHPLQTKSRDSRITLFSSTNSKKSIDRNKPFVNCRVMIKKLLPLLLLILIGCSKNGVYETYYKDSQLVNFVTTYKNGEIVSRQEFLYYSNGQLKEVNSINYHNQKDGTFKYYYENGQLEGEKTYKSGELDGPYKWYYDNGKLKVERTYKNGFKVGPYTEYY